MPNFSKTFLSFRIGSHIIKKIDSLIPFFSKSDYNIQGRISRTTVVRLLIQRGLESFEKEFNIKEK